VSLVSIDPGLRVIGYAEWYGGQLFKAGLIKNPCDKTVKDDTVWLGMVEAITQTIQGVHEVVIEKPQVYVASRSKGDPNDLINLALVVGAIGMAFHLDETRVKTYRPAEWKGQVPKDVTERRVHEALTDAELGRVIWPVKSLCHNVIDAIGIGLHHLRRRGGK
jgi:Holliday junction resolvasome RuvABC endonuclease subunit